MKKRDNFNLVKIIKMNKSIYLLLIMALFTACENTGKTTTATTSNGTTTAQTSTAPAPAKAAIEAAQSKSNVSASTKQNMTTGYWHIGGAVNVPVKSEKGTEGYVGKWLKFNPDMSFIYGIDGEDKYTGTWLFNEDGEYITIQSDKEDAFFANEWNTKQIGDIVLLLGNTPNNPKGGQIKLVRQNTKIIDHNPN